MNRSRLRIAIIVLTLITAAIHLVLGVGSLSFDVTFAVSFILNGLAYLVLLYALLRPPAFLAGRSALVHYVFIAFTVVTILAYVVINGDFTNPLGMFTKLVEVLLIVALWLHLRADS